MDPFTAAVVGSAITGGLGFMGAQKTNKANVRMAREQMEFQREMSNTQYQRGMEDMRKAGLNPILAYQQGGASSPMGASIPQIDELAPAVNSAQSALRLSQDLKNLKQAEKTAGSQEQLNNALKKKAIEDAKVASSTAKNIQQTNKILKPEVTKAEQVDKARKTKTGNFLNMFEEVRQKLLGGSNPIPSIKGR